MVVHSPNPRPSGSAYQQRMFERSMGFDVTVGGTDDVLDVENFRCNADTGIHGLAGFDDSLARDLGVSRTFDRYDSTDRVRVGVDTEDSNVEVTWWGEEWNGGVDGT